MKISATILGVLVTGSLFSASIVRAQDLAGTMRKSNSMVQVVPKNDTQPDNPISLRAALKEVEKSYRIKFAINDQLVEGKYLDPDKIRYGKLSKTLISILSPFKLHYKLVDGYYIIQSSVTDETPAEPLSDGDSGRLDPLTGPQTITSPPVPAAFYALLVSGQVTSLQDEIPLPGVVITVKGNKTATQVTGANGMFNINVPAANSVLVFSHVGFRTQEVTVNGRSSIKVQLEKDVTNLQEVVINVPYGKQTRASFTGSAVTLGEKELAGQPHATFQSSLQGNVAGLMSMESTGQPGAMPDIRIRGISSLNGSVTPLYVIDGIPMVDAAPAQLAFSSNLLGGLNPNDIETLTVLKDASATSIYGSRGANGVILITTKSGAAGKTKFNLTAQQGYTKMTSSKRNKPLSTAEMTELLIEGVINNDFTPAIMNITTPEAAYAYLITQGLNPDVNTDWLDVITQTGKYSQYNLSASGGTEKNSFYFSGGYYKQDAITRGQGYDRLNGRLTFKNKASERLTFSATMSANVQNLNTVPGAGTGQNPIRSLNRFVPWLAPYTATGEYSTALTYNPEIVRRENVYDTKIYQLVGSFGAEFKIWDALSYEFKAGIDLSSTSDFRFWSPIWPDGRGVNGRGAEYNTTWKNWNITNLLKYRKQVNQFAFDATLGQEASDRYRKRVSTQADGYSFDGLLTLANAATPFVSWSDEAEASIVSYFLNTSFNYRRRYYLNATARRDGSSRFGALSRYGNFWSVGAAWNMQEEPFMKSVPVIDELKLRASYGLNGNQMDSYYNARGYYLTGNNYGGDPGFAIASIENAKFSWESNKPFNIGLDFAVLNRRLTGTVEWYSRTTSSLLANVDISYTNGVPSINENTGSIRNKGFELTLNASAVNAKKEGGFEWRTGLNLSTQKNTVIALSPKEPPVSGVYNRIPGEDTYQFYLRGYAGVDPETGKALWYLNGEKAGTTTDIAKASSFKQAKSALPDFFGGFTNSFGYKGFTLSALIYFKWGGYIYDGWGSFTQSDGSGAVGEAAAMTRMYYENHWQKAGDNAMYPKVVYRGTQSGISTQSSTRFLYDGSYIRLRDVNLSYSLPVRRWGLPANRVEIYAKASNLFTYTKDKYLPYDPEVGVSGILDQNLPISRQIMFGLNVSF